MNWKRILLGCACTLAMAAPAGFAAETCSCVSGKPTAESYSWNFHREADRLFRQIQDESALAAAHATKLQSYADSPGLSWQTHGEQLSDLKTEINDMGRKLCRLEAIHTALLPWQRATVRNISKDLVLMANSADDAIRFVNTHPSDLWSRTYTGYADNLANLSNNLEKASGEAAEYARVNRKDRELRQEMGTGARS